MDFVQIGDNLSRPVYCRGVNCYALFHYHRNYISNSLKLRQYLPRNLQYSLGISITGSNKKCLQNYILFHSNWTLCFGRVVWTVFSVRVIIKFHIEIRDWVPIPWYYYQPTIESPSNIRRLRFGKIFKLFKTPELSSCLKDKTRQATQWMNLYCPIDNRMWGSAGRGGPEEKGMRNRHT